jgi:branched-chain amino acid transport system ATP-binding protein
VPGALLELRNVEARYGPVAALHGISLTVGEGEIVAVLGANGAGKTTTLRAVSGTVRRSGEILLDGKPIGRSPEATARQKVAHVPEGRGTFVELTVEDNLRLGAYTRRDGGVAADLDRVLDWFPRLRERLPQQAGTLSGGEQQMLALARALMLSPRLLLLDEPSLGLAPLVVAELFAIVRRLNEEEGLAVLVVEQNATVALAASARAYVLESGSVAVEGPSAELREHDDVRRSYLGY